MSDLSTPGSSLVLMTIDSLQPDQVRRKLFPMITWAGSKPLPFMSGVRAALDIAAHVDFAYSAFRASVAANAPAATHVLAVSVVVVGEGPVIIVMGTPATIETLGAPL
jgi:hypothetical protein